jgi:pimeloyl-ACP methyl ester carboxylesterase
MKRFYFCFSIICLLGCQSGLSQNLIVNGSFEFPGFPTVTNGPRPPGQMEIDAPGNIGGWTVSATGDVFLHKTPDIDGGGLFSFAEDGNYYLDLSGSGFPHASVYQDFNTIPGASYGLNFYIAGTSASPSSIINVQIDGTDSLLNVTLAPTASFTTLNWTLQTFHFVANSTSTRLSFVDTSLTDDNASFVDNVSVQKSQANLNTGLVAYYPFNGNANDATGNGHDGNVIGTILTTNRFGTTNSAYYFPGNGELISVPTSDSLNLLNGYTLSAWINFEVGGTYAPRIADKFMYSFYTYLNGSARSLGMYFSDQTSLTTITNLYAGQWYHVVSSYDLQRRKIYVNGSLLASDSCTFALIPNSLPLEIGRKPVYGYDSFKGIIDDVRIYNRALSDSEVQQLYSLPDIGTAPTPPTVMQTNRTPTSTEVGGGTIPTGPTHFKVFTNGDFVSGVALDPNKMTVVLTHGWNSDPTAWAKYMAELLQFKLGAAALNIVAWDWNVEATSPWNNPGKAAANTQGQGRVLGMNLLAALGSHYSKPIHFIGHSFGTLVNATAADYLHTNGFAWQNTHMTLFDEAEVGSHFDSAANQFRTVTTLLKNDSAQQPFWNHPLPNQFAWADNYVSLVGLLHHDAANVVLTNFFPNPNFYPTPTQIGLFIDELASFHGYPCLWYDDTVVTPSGSLMGWRWSFEENSLNPPPAVNTVFIQSFSGSDLDVVPTNFNSASQLLDARLKKALPSLVYSVVDHAPAVVTAVNQVLITIEDAIPQDPYTLTTGPAEAWGMIINLQTGPSSSGSFSPQTKVRPLIPMPNDLSGGTNSPAYVWLPLAVPSNAVAISFDFILQGEGADDLFAVALNGTNVFSLETSLIQTNVTVNSGQIDVSEYAGTNVVLFLGIVGGTSTNANVTVSSLRFYSTVAPSLQAQTVGNNFVLTWPLSASDYVLETSTDFTSWTTNTDVPVIVDLQNTVTNSISDGARFYRLKK